MLSPLVLCALIWRDFDMLADDIATDNPALATFLRERDRLTQSLAILDNLILASAGLSKTERAKILARLHWKTKGGVINAKAEQVVSGGGGNVMAMRGVFDELPPDVVEKRLQVLGVSTYRIGNVSTPEKTDDVSPINHQPPRSESNARPAKHHRNERRL
jgi:hypothetical protein